MYTRNSQISYGGFGCGAGSDDYPGNGGGYTLGTGNSTTASPAYSYCKNALQRVDGANEEEGKVIINFKEYQRPSTDYVVNTSGSNVLTLPTDVASGDTITINNTGVRQSGTYVRYTIPTDVLVQIEAWGAGGSVGNMYSSVTQPGGKGAYLKSADITLAAGTELLILVGQKGDINPAAYNGDGSGRRRRRRNLYMSNSTYWDCFIICIYRSHTKCIYQTIVNSSWRWTEVVIKAIVAVEIPD